MKGHEKGRNALSCEKGWMVFIIFSLKKGTTPPLSVNPQPEMWGTSLTHFNFYISVLPQASTRWDQTSHNNILFQAF